MTDREREIVMTYRASASLKEAAHKLGISKQYVHQIVRRCAPEAMNRAGIPRHKR